MHLVVMLSAFAVILNAAPCDEVREAWQPAADSEARRFELVHAAILSGANWSRAATVDEALVHCAATMKDAFPAELRAFVDLWSAPRSARDAPSSTGDAVLRGTQQDWSYIGPFLYGKTEYDGDVLASPRHPLLRRACTGSSPLLETKMTTLNCYAHVRLVSQLLTSVVPSLLPALKLTLSSMLNERSLFAVSSETMPGGVVQGFRALRNTAWPSAAAKRTFGPTSVAVQHDELSHLVQALSDMTVLEFVGWAYTTVLIEGAREGVSVQVLASGVHSLFYSYGDGPVIPIACDQYSRRYEFAIAEPPAGRATRAVPLRVMARLRGSGQAGFSLTVQLRSLERPTLKLLVPLVMPDYVWGGFLGGEAAVAPRLHPRGAWISVPVGLMGGRTDDVVERLSFGVRDASGGNTKYCVNAECLTEAKNKNNSSVPILFDTQRKLHRRAVTASIEEEIDAWTSKDGSVYLGTPGLVAGQVLATRLYVAVLRGGNGKCPVGAVNITVRGTLTSGVAVSGSLIATFRCRDAAKETFIFTHMDRDGSIVGAAARAPILSTKDVTDEAASVPTVLTLHGTGVSAQSQADSYKVGSKAGDFTFGVRGAWVVAPDRHGAHNWEGLGRLSALAALFHVAYASAALKLTVTPHVPSADPNRVVYAGHSMGGHGALHLAVMDPDRAIAVMLLAPWISKEHYSTANTIFALDRSRVDGVTRGALEASIAGNDPDLVIANIKHLPVLIRVGASDRTVHPFYARRIHRLLLDAGNTQVEYDEVKDKEHWWWDTSAPNDGGCMNDKTIRTFLKKVLSGAHSTHMTRREMHLVSVEHFPCVARSVCVAEQVSVSRLSTVVVDVSSSDRAIHVTTRNVKALVISFDLSSRVFLDGHAFEPAPCRDVDANSGSMCVSSEGTLRVGSVSACRDSRGQWERCATLSLLEVGPFRVYSERTAAISLSATGDAERDAVLMKYGVYLSNLHFVAYDSFMPIVVKAQSASPLRHRSELQLRYSNDNVKSKHHVRLSIVSHRDEWLSDRVTALVQVGSERALAHAVLDIGQPTVPPMMRCPFGNVLLSDSESDATRAALGWASIDY